MTTLPPTTLAPTTVAPTLAPTTPPPWDPLKGTEIDCVDNVLSFDFAIDGICANTWVETDAIGFDPAIDGDFNIGHVIDADVLVFDFKFQIGSGDDHSAYVHVGIGQCGFIIWSKIGSFDFTIDHSNEAGKSYLRDIGNICGIRKLADKIIVYGSSGICALTASELAWGYKLLSKTGVMSRDAHIGNENIHWYINEEGDLFEISDKLKRIGYKEFLSSLYNPVMSLDENRQCIYICDGGTGYVFSYADYSLGEGGCNISGFGYDGSTEIVLAPDTEGYGVDNLFVMLATDILDMGTRKEKTILSVEVSTNLDENIFVALEYRTDINGGFSWTPSVKLNPHGIAYIPCYGIEFRIWLMVANDDLELVYTELEIDQLTINGVIHGVSYRNLEE